uniref:CW-type domain-containing protein n=1 Tax=Branchiostoma floridae TaxID=7739 RepID=C3YBX8_BRAFL|eukprot:XP_002606143.1 hypothetical protein BRAFLDRAFT_102742 [Branchiostoma floridae]
MPQIKEWTEEIFAQLRSQSITLRSKGPVYCEDSRRQKAGTEENADEESDSSHEQENQSDDSLKEETRIQLEDEAWIQCDKCSKWRRVTKQVAAEYADKDWLCSLNTDSKHNSCTDLEETHDERKARKYGLRYVLSEIAVGSLVWARLDGFARWPAVLSPDPESGEHTEVDEDGDVTWYHVEFLGPKHSHSWCTYNRVEVYSKTDATTNIAQVAKSRTKKKGRRYPRVIAPKTSSALQQKNLNTAIKEADHLMSLTNKQRLQKCQFLWSPRTRGDSDEDSSKGYRVKSSPVVDSNCCKKISKDKRNTGKKGTIKRSGSTTNRQTEDADRSSNKHKNMQASGTGVQCSASSALSPDLGSCTEKDFRMMVSAFMTSHGKHVSSPPVWNGSKVSLYQLFTAVMEKGGYSQLSKRGKAGGWAGIYRLLTKCSMSSHGGQAAKKYYERWPAVLSPDLESGEHTEVDEDGDVTWYHVEFLGPKHSHSWCTYNRVEVYSKTDATTNIAQPPDLGSCTEKDFSMMVSAFMTSHGKHVSSPPVWNGSKVSLYQLFTAVMEKGGYSQLSKRGKAGGWAGIYRLLTKCSMSSHGGQAAKKYYERNLLPYEMFLNGCSVEEIQQVMKKPPCYSNNTFSPTTEQHLMGDDHPEDTLDEEMLKMEDMENILISLDESIETGMYDAKSDKVGVPAAEVERHEACMMEELEAMQVDLDELNTSLGQELLQL